MKKLILLLALSFIVATTAMAQVSASAAVKVYVVNSLSITKLNDLDFGQLTTTAGATTVDPKADANAGEFQIAGTPGATVNVQFQAPGNLANQDGSGNITFTATKPSYGTSSSQSSSTLFNSSNGGSVTLGNDTNGTLYMWIGGTVNPNGATPGHYQGTYTATVTYGT